MGPFQPFLCFLWCGMQHDLAKLRELWAACLLLLGSLESFLKAAAGLGDDSASNNGLRHRKGGQHACTGRVLHDGLTDDLMAHVFRAFASQDVRALGLACCACRDFNRVISADGAGIWKSAFFQQSGPPMIAQEMEGAVNGFGGYKALALSRLPVRDLDANSIGHAPDPLEVEEYGSISSVLGSETDDHGHPVPPLASVLFVLTANGTPAGWAVVEPDGTSRFDGFYVNAEHVSGSLSVPLRLLGGTEDGRKGNRAESRALLQAYLESNGQVRVGLEVFVKERGSFVGEHFLEGQAILSKTQIDLVWVTGRSTRVRLDSTRYPLLDVHGWSLPEKGAGDRDRWHLEWGLHLRSERARSLRLEFKRTRSDVGLPTDRHVRLVEVLMNQRNFYKRRPAVTALTVGLPEEEEGLSDVNAGDSALQWGVEFFPFVGDAYSMKYTTPMTYWSFVQ
jgi:hypothetical protein